MQEYSVFKQADVGGFSGWKYVGTVTAHSPTHALRIAKRTWTTPAVMPKKGAQK